MTKDELQKLLENLEAEERSLRDQLNIIANKNPMVRGGYQVRIPNYGEDEDENSQETTDLDRNLALEHELEKHLNEILKTKQRIKDGNYGKCDNCSQEIPPARLKVVSIAALCMSCAKISRPR